MSTALVVFTRQDFSLQVTEEARIVEEQALESAALIRSVSDDLTRDLAVEAQRQLKGYLAAVEKTRVEVKAPVLKLARNIDRFAEKLANECQCEYARLDRLVCEHEQQKRAEAARLEAIRQREIEQERQRLAEEQRKADAERQRLIDEERRKAQAIADHAERERQLVLAKAMEERARLQREQELARQQELLEAKRIELGPPQQPTTAEGQTFREEWDYEVMDIQRLYQVRGTECVRLEPKRSAIRALLGQGVRDIPGLRIFRVSKNQVRSERPQKAIEV